jgi:hypothetical protein
VRSPLPTGRRESKNIAPHYDSRYL